MYHVTEMCRFMLGGSGVGRWNSLEESPFANVSSVHEPVFWFPGVNISQVAVHIKDMAELPAKLRAIPAGDVQRMQAALAKAEPLFRYRCSNGSPKATD